MSIFFILCSTYEADRRPKIPAGTQHQNSISYLEPNARTDRRNKFANAQFSARVSNAHSRSTANREMVQLKMDRIPLSVIRAHNILLGAIKYDGMANALLRENNVVYRKIYWEAY